MKSVGNIRIDIQNYLFWTWVYSQKNFQIVTKFIDKRTYKIKIFALNLYDQDIDSLSILSCQTDSEGNLTGKTQSIEYKSKEITVISDWDLEEGPEIEYEIPYSLKGLGCYWPAHIPKEEFENKFDTKFDDLSIELCAVGIENNYWYVYNLPQHYHNISNMHYNFLLKVFRLFNPTISKFYFVISHSDGYMEYSVPSENRDTPVYHKEFLGKYINMEKNEYPILHDKKWVLAMSSPQGVPWVLDVVDRHYEYCNFYNSFRSIHRGIPFDDKINQVIYAGTVANSSINNFTVRRDIGIQQREYFYTLKWDFVVAERGKWITEETQVKYKYILNIDGNAACWDAIAWKMNSGSVILKVDSRWRQWFYDEFLAWEHYVPIKDDFTDLEEKYLWCENHPEECKKMVRNCMDLFQKVYKYTNVIKATQKMFEKMM